MKTKMVNYLSLRCKFKTPEIVELCIIDSRSGEIFMYNIQFREQKSKLQSFIETVVDEASEDSEQEEQIDNEEVADNGD